MGKYQLAWSQSKLARNWTQTDPYCYANIVNLSWLVAFCWMPFMWYTKQCGTKTVGSFKGLWNDILNVSILFNQLKQCLKINYALFWTLFVVFQKCGTGLLAPNTFRVTHSIIFHYYLLHALCTWREPWISI